MEQVNFGVVGIIGYAASHLRAIRRAQSRGIRLWGVVARFPEENPQLLEELKAEGVAIFSSVDEMLAAGEGKLHVVTLPTSIPSHAPLAIQAMRAGYDVYCEKPPAATIQDLDQMIATSKETGRFCAVGFQGIFHWTTQNLKARLLAGEWGEVKGAACLFGQPRAHEYYRRNRWAGQIAVDGRWVLDGPMNNAFAHQLQAMLYLTGPSHHECAEPVFVHGELYRAKPYIEGDDTGTIRVECERGIEVYFAASHSVDHQDGPLIEIETSQTTLQWQIGKETVRLSSGEEVALVGEGSMHHGSFLNAADVVRGRAEQPLCRAENTRAFVLSINGAHESSGRIHPIPSTLVEEADLPHFGLSTILPGLSEVLKEAFAERKLLSELGVEWATATKPVDVREYTHFPQEPSLHNVVAS